MPTRPQRSSPQAIGRELKRLGSRLSTEFGSVSLAGREMLRRYPKVPPMQAYRYAAGLSQDEAAAKYNEVTQHRTYLGGTGVNSWEAWQRGGSGGACPAISDLIVLGIAYGRCGHLDQSPISPHELLGSSFKQLKPQDQIAVGELADRSSPLVPEPREAAPNTSLLTAEPGGLLTARLEIPTSLREETTAAFTPDVERVLIGLIDNGAEAANLFGSHQLVEMTQRNAAIINQLRPVTKGARYSALALLGSRFAEFLSWIYEELECGDIAADWLNKSLDWAMEADDDAMTAYVLSRKSHHAMRQGDSQRAMTLAGRAAKYVDIPPKVRAFALQQQARGLAHLDERAEALRLFDLAQELTDVQGAENPNYVGYCVPAYIDLQRAGAWAAMGDPRRGAAELATALQELDPTYRTDHAVFGGRRAQALALDSRPDEAVGVARQALAIAAETQCSRALNEITEAIQLLKRWEKVPDVQQLSTEFQIIRNGLSALNGQN